MQKIPETEPCKAVSGIYMIEWRRNWNHSISVNLFHLFNPLDAVHIPNGHIHRYDSLVLRHFDPALSLSVPDDPSGCHFACKIHLVQHYVVW